MDRIRLLWLLLTAAGVILISYAVGEGGTQWLAAPLGGLLFGLGLDQLTRPKKVDQ